MFGRADPKKPARIFWQAFISLLLYFGVTFFFEFGINQIRAPGFGLSRYRKAIILEIAGFD